MRDGGVWWIRAQIPLLAATVALPVIQHLVSAPALWPHVFTWPGRFLGAALVLAGAVLFRVASAVLGRDLIALPAPRNGGTLRRRGVYGRLRHPIYAAIVICATGWALLWSSGVGLLLCALCAVFFSRKVRVEEIFLRAQYPEYEAYAREVPQFLPRWG
jgi:protein-S-isoprenylcysteine O-methyltransferase Ste14